MIACIQLKQKIPLLALLLTGLASPILHGADADSEACKKNLGALFAAIQAYQKEHKDLPPWLSDLVPKHLKNPNLLICPTVKKTGAVKNYGIEDPNLSTAYTYEFSEAVIPETIYKGGGRTMEEWKRRQMSLVGSKVPMIRCHNHERVLNLLYDGRITEGAPGWEGDLADEIDPAELSADRIFAVEAANLAATRARAEIPPRPPNTSPQLVDLSRFYNAALTESWHRTSPSEPPANDLSWLPRGVQNIGGVDFDLRGLVQLASRKLNHPRFTHSIRNVRVEQKARKLHLLHGTGWSAPDGTPIAMLIVRMANGEKHEFVIRYGDHVVDWVAQDVQLKDSERSKVAWTGRSPATDSQTLLHLYKTEWTNPSPDQTIATVDYIGANEDPAPFLIAITAE